MGFIKKNLLYIVLIVIVIVGGIYAGLRFLKPASASSNSVAQTAGQSPRGQGGFGRGNRGNFKPLHGTISSLDSSTITMKADDGSSKNISVSSDSKISQMDNGTRTTLTISDLKTGDEINVMAEDETANPIVARMIIIGTFSPPTGGPGGQGGGWNGNSQDSPGSAGTSAN